MIAPGQRLALDCADIDAEGAGVAELGVPTAEGGGAAARRMKIHVAGALPGERVTADVEHVSPHRADAWARLVTVDAAAAWRIAPVCPAWGACGGCVLQHFDYPAQAAWKGARMASLVRASPQLAAAIVRSCVASPRSLGYRNNSKLVCGRASHGGIQLGAFAPRSHHVVDLAGCRVAAPPLDDVAAVVRRILDDERVAAYDERSLTGLVRHVVLRVSHVGNVLATFVTARPDWPDGASIARALLAARPDVVGVVHNANPSRGNSIYGEEDRVLSGYGHLEDAVGATRLRVSSRAFFQANREVAALAYAEIAAAVDSLPRGGRVVDVYAGVGGIALTLAARDAAADVVGIEEHPAAVDDARASARLNGITNARFVAGDAASRLGELDRADVVILNPPRRGCDPDVLDAAAALRPRLIAYLSCAPDTLVRDLARLSGLGFETRSVTPYDMLPHTPHVEALAVAAPGPSAHQQRR